jgi:hypothetical protein
MSLVLKSRWIRYASARPAEGIRTMTVSGGVVALHHRPIESLLSVWCYHVIATDLIGCAQLQRSDGEFRS